MFIYQSAARKRDGSMKRQIGLIKSQRGSMMGCGGSRRRGSSIRKARWPNEESRWLIRRRAAESRRQGGVNKEARWLSKVQRCQEAQ
jgi:hypothetical protein